MIKIDNLSKTYSSKGEEEVHALNDVNLLIPSHGLVVITGSSGCGKTTLLNILAGFDKPTDGEIYVDGKKLSGFSERQLDDYRLKHLGFVFQNYNLIEVLTVRENIELSLKMLGLEVNEVSERATEIIEKLGLLDLADKSVLHLSGGQKQRVSIARAIVKKPKLILADEPTGNLDEKNSRMIFELLKDIARNCTVLVVTHDKKLAEEFADNIVELSYGCIEKNSVIENEIECSTEDNANIVQAKISKKLCFKFANKLIEKRSFRATITVLILMLTFSLIYVLSMISTKEEEKTIANYLESTYSNGVNVYRKLSESESVFLEFEDTVTTGKSVRGELEDIAGADNINYSLSAIAIYGDNQVKADLEGQNGIALGEGSITKRLAHQLNISEQDLPVVIKVKNSEVTITSIIDKYYLVGNEEIGTIFVSKETWADIVKNSTGKLCGISIFSKYGPSTYAFVEKSFKPASNCKDTLLMGRLPENNNEVVVPEQDLLAYGYDVDSVLGSNVELYNLYDQKYGNAFGGTINLYDYCGSYITIVGVSEDANYVFTDAVYEAIMEDAPYYQCEYILNIDSDKLENIIGNLLNSGFFFDDKTLDSLNSNWVEIDELMTYLRYALLVLVILTVLQMISMFSFSVTDCRKTIGTLRAMGASEKNINVIFICENIIVSVISVVFAIVIALSVVIAMNNHFIVKDYMGANLNTIIPNSTVIILVGILSVVMSLLGVLLPLHKLNKISINELLQTS